MRQKLTADLTQYHSLFSGGRCQGWELEELIVRAIQSDTQAQHPVRWTEAGHDDLADITVTANGTTHLLQIKSGRENSQSLIISGYRLGRFGGDFTEITNYLNAESANIISVPYRKIEDQQGRRHAYKICYVDVANLTGLDSHGWETSGKQFVQTNDAGVHFSLRPSMSWQVWWRIPVGLVVETDEFIIG